MSGLGDDWRCRVKDDPSHTQRQLKVKFMIVLLGSYLIKIYVAGRDWRTSLNMSRARPAHNFRNPCVGLFFFKSSILHMNHPQVNICILSKYLIFALIHVIFSYCHLCCPKVVCSILAPLHYALSLTFFKLIEMWYGMCVWFSHIPSLASWQIH